jgi:hypothetical protein
LAPKRWFDMSNVTPWTTALFGTQKLTWYDWRYTQNNALVWHQKYDIIRLTVPIERRRSLAPKRWFDMIDVTPRSTTLFITHTKYQFKVISGAHLHSRAATHSLMSVKFIEDIIGRQDVRFIQDIIGRQDEILIWSWTFESEVVSGPNRHSGTATNSSVVQSLNRAADMVDRSPETPLLFWLGSSKLLSCLIRADVLTQPHTANGCVVFDLWIIQLWFMEQITLIQEANLLHRWSRYSWFITQIPIINKQYINDIWSSYRLTVHQER